jgi:hypothetical protein
MFYETVIATQRNAWQEIVQFNENDDKIKQNDVLFA